MADEKNTEGMTDETGSKPAPTPTPQTRPDTLAARLAEAIKPVLGGSTTAPKGTAPEPVILEEHVVERPTPTTAPQMPQPTFANPQPKTKAPDVNSNAQPPFTPEIADTLDVGLDIPNRPRPRAQVGNSIPSLMPDSLDTMPLVSGNKTTPSSLIPPTVDTPPLSANISPPQAIPQETFKPVPPVGQVTPPPPTPSSISTDIEKILRQVKLPERRDFKGGADTKPPAPAAPPQEKNLASLVTKPPEDAQSANAMTSRQGGANLSSVHTLKDDLQHVVKEKKMSLVRAVSLEQDRKRNELIEEDFGRRERHKRVSGILFASILLFFMGGAALFGVYLVMMSHSATDVQQLNSLVFAEQSIALPLDNANPSELKRRVAAQRQAQSGSLGSITSIVPIYQGNEPSMPPRQATTAEFFSAMGFNAPENLTRALGATFFFGLHVVDKNAPVLVVPITNYDRAFAGMLEWEDTMNADLSPTFTPVPATILDVNGIPSARIFRDDVMRNYDVRELKDDSGQIQLYYSFPSPNLLIIAESPYSFPELLSRLQSVRRL